ncbi:MAG: hypothetical protein WCH34_08275 [Bacteroidota bacterium]
MFSHSYIQLKWGLIIFTVILIILGYVFYKLTGGYIFKYSNKIKSEQTAQFLIGAQWVISVISALYLPNNLLSNIKFFHDTFEKNTLWIPVSMIVILGLTLLIIGILINISCDIFMTDKTDDKNGTHSS